MNNPSMTIDILTMQDIIFITGYLIQDFAYRRTLSTLQVIKDFKVVVCGTIPYSTCNAGGCFSEACRITQHQTKERSSLGDPRPVLKTT